MKEEFDAWCAIKSDSDYREGAWDAWQAACSGRQQQVNCLTAQVGMMQKALRQTNDKLHQQDYYAATMLVRQALMTAPSEAIALRSAE